MVGTRRLMESHCTINKGITDVACMLSIRGR
jgi:hypothetical protein